MKDRFNEPDVVDILSRWADSHSGRIAGRRLQLGVGIGTIVGGAGLIVEGLWNHDVEHIVSGVAGISMGSFVAKYADIQLEQIRTEATYR